MRGPAVEAFAGKPRTPQESSLRFRRGSCEARLERADVGPGYVALPEPRSVQRVQASALGNDQQQRRGHPRRAGGGGEGADDHHAVARRAAAVVQGLASAGPACAHGDRRPHPGHARDGLRPRVQDQGGGD
eukprot:9186059-Alexandrium_andersonii.AAC.1